MADDPTLSAIQGVAQDVRDLRADLTGRMDQMLTRREHEAEVRRIDADAARARDALAAHEAAADQRLAAITVAMETGDRRIETLIEVGEQRRVQAQEAQAERRRADRRWVASWAVGAGAFVVAATQLVRALVG